ncbi:HD domain-containing protein [Otoolea muris]|uniref:HD domain-containing protein n=1 Tax=Otoolea muris TaxID=2941515 RepID=UPI00203D1BDA|nr:HD domain-containing protein [Otoolea muris]
MEHSFGCMYLCGNIFYSSLCNADRDTLRGFFGQAERELEGIIDSVCGRSTGRQYEHKLGGVYRDIRNRYENMKIEGGIYNYYKPANIESDSYVRIYMLLFEGIRLGGLLHDIGHPPYSHISENALNYLYGTISGKTGRSKREDEFLAVLEGMAGENHQLHEEMGVKIANILLLEAIRNVTEEESREGAVYEEQLYRILIKEITLRILQESSPFFKDLHAIVDGTLDGDRLDYVSRDPENSGFQLGRTEFDRLIHKMRLCRLQAHYLFCPSSSTVNAVEDFLMKRWNLYKNIIYHHRVVKTDYLLQNIIIKLAEDYFKEDYGDAERDEKISGAYVLPYDISGLWKANVERPSNMETAYAINQWTDAWLITVLKTTYFRRYIDQKSCLHDQLEEFLTNKKHYDSLIKRREEFQEIDSGVSEILSGRAGDLREAIQRLKRESECLEAEKKRTVFDIEGYVKIIDEITGIAQNNKDKSFAERGGFILGVIKRKLFPGVETFSCMLDQMMSRLGFAPGEMFYAEKNLKTGTNKGLYFYQPTNKEGEPVSLDKISNISYVLDDNVLYSPFFFLYLNKKSSKREDFHALRRKIGAEIGNCIAEYILDTITGLSGNKKPLEKNRTG